MIPYLDFRRARGDSTLRRQKRMLMSPTRKGYAA